MPRLRDGEKRPARAAGKARKVIKAVADAVDDDTEHDDGKDKAAQSLGRRGGNARAVALSRTRRVEIARNAAAERWKKKH